MERSHRELCIDVVILRGIFKNNRITLFPYYTLYLKLEVIVFTVDSGAIMRILYVT